MMAESTPLSPVLAFVGHDRFLRNDAVARILGTPGSATDRMGPSRVDGAGALLSDVLDEVRTISLLGGRRVVVVDDADSFIKANRAILERYCGDPAPDGTLILLCNTLPRNTRLYKIIEAHGAVLACDPPKGRAVLSWITDRARSAYGKRLNGSAAQRLRDHLGDAPGPLDAELAKLSTYVGARDEINTADIEVLTGHHREEKIFAVADAMASGDAAGALRQWEQVLATDRAAPARAVAGLAWGIRRLLDARRDWEDGVAVRDLSRRLYVDPMLLEQRLRRAAPALLEQQLRDLLAADLALKTGLSTIESAIESFIVKHAHSARVSPRRDRGTAA